MDERALFAIWDEPQRAIIAEKAVKLSTALWSGRQIEELRGLIGRGLSIATIAKVIGRGEATVRQKALRLGLMDPRSRRRS